MMDWIKDIEPHWAWLAIGLILAAAEMAIPGVFLIWMAGAAIITGLVTWQLDISVPLQVVIFAVLSIVSVMLGRRYLRSHPIEDADPNMNRRGARLVGEIATVSQAIEAGSGRVRYGDSEWLAKGADLPAGTHVRITGCDGVVLLVEATTAGA